MLAGGFPPTYVKTIRYIMQIREAFKTRTAGIAILYNGSTFCTAT